MIILKVAAVRAQTEREQAMKTGAHVESFSTVLFYGDEQHSDENKYRFI